MQNVTAKTDLAISNITEEFHRAEMFQPDGKSEAFSVFSFSCFMTVLSCSNYLMVR